MSSEHKRALSSDERSISPPPTRRKLTRDEPSQSEQLPVWPAYYLRIYSWNVNGVGPFLQRPISFSKAAHYRSPLRAFLARHNWPHILCLQEVKINPKDIATQRALQNAANLDSPVACKDEASSSSGPTYTAQFSLPRDKYNATGFGGKVHGVATLIRDDLAQTLTIPNALTTTRSVPWDLEGRVLITTLCIPNSNTTTRSTTTSTATSTSNNNLHIVHAYWPNGTGLPYRSPATGGPLGTRHDYKLRFHNHILFEALSLHSQQTSSQTPSSNQKILLIGDMNIAPTRLDGHPNLRTSPTQHVYNRQDFIYKFLDSGNEDGFQGLDVWRYLHGTERKYTYFPRGRTWGSSCDRVDLVVVGRGLVEPQAEKMDSGKGVGGRGQVEEVEVEGKQEEERQGAKGAVVEMQIYDNELDRGHSDHVPLSVTLDLAKLKSLEHGTSRAGKVS